MKKSHILLLIIFLFQSFFAQAQTAPQNDSTLSESPSLQDKKEKNEGTSTIQSTLRNIEPVILTVKPKIIVAGVVSRIQGIASARNKGITRSLQILSNIHQGDQIETREKSRLKILMIDGSIIVLGDNTGFLIKKYSYSDQSNSGEVSLSLTKGFFKTSTGKFRRKSRRFRVKTALATIGVRGTDFWGGLWNTETFEVALLAGTALEIFNDGGKVIINKPGFGTTITSAGVSPSAPEKWNNQKVQKAVQTVTFR